MSKIAIDEKTLLQAIEDFNEWNGAARLYFDMEDGTFNTSVYHNDVGMTETFSSDNFVSVYGKNEVGGNIKIGTKRKEYVIKFANLLLEGYYPDQVEYQLADEYV